MVQPFVTALVVSLNVPKPPSLALTIPLIVALSACRFPASVTLNGAASI